MSSYQRERDETIVLLSAEGLPLPTIRRLFALSQTLHRLAVAQCNGDWPADNGERKTVVCPGCEGCWVQSSMKRCSGLETPEILASVPKGFRPVFCPDCRATQQVKDLIGQANTLLFGGDGWREKGPRFHAVFAGDPRGCVVKIAVPSGKTNDYGREGICIPVRER